MSEPNLSQVPFVLFPCRQQIVAALCCDVKHLRPIFGLENAFSDYFGLSRDKLGTGICLFIDWEVGIELLGTGIWE